MMRARRAALASVATGAALLFGARLACAGIPHPELALEAGRTFGVSSPTSGQYDQGGLTFGGSVLWNWENRFRFGVQTLASDSGSQTEHIMTNDTPPVDYGVTVQGHRAVFSASWRTDWLGPAVGKFGRTFVTGSYGYFRFRNDHLGDPRGSVSAVGGSLGLGLEHSFTPKQTLGLVAAGTWMSDDFTPHYGSAAFEYKWRW